MNEGFIASFILTALDALASRRAVRVAILSLEKKWVVDGQRKQVWPTAIANDETRAPEFGWIAHSAGRTAGNDRPPRINLLDHR